MVPVSDHEVRSFSVKELVKNCWEIIQVEPQEYPKRMTKIVMKAPYMRIIYIIHQMANLKDNRKKIFPFEDCIKRRFQFKLAFGSAPHPHKVWKGGEDAFYVSKNIILVADGVGGWTKMGIDSGVYARKLVSIVKELIQNDREMYFIQKPEELAIRAVQENEEKGSSTLSILTLHPITGVLRSYHIGDSIFGIFSNESQHFLSQQQQRSFNVPFQVYGGVQNILKNSNDDSDEQQLVSDVFKGCYGEFMPKQLQNKRILLASDGLWDNVHLSDIQKELFSSNNHVSIARSLIKQAKQNSQIEQFQSPFYLKAKQQNQDVPKGGKIDDVTVIVASIIVTQ